MSNHLVVVAPWGGFALSPQAFTAAARDRWPSTVILRKEKPHPAIAVQVDGDGRVRPFTLTLFLGDPMLSSDGLWEQAAETAAWFVSLNELPGPTRLLFLDMAMTSKAEIGPGMSGAEILAALTPPEDGYFDALPWVSESSEGPESEQPGGTVKDGAEDPGRG